MKDFIFENFTLTYTVGFLILIPLLFGLMWFLYVLLVGAEDYYNNKKLSKPEYAFTAFLLASAMLLTLGSGIIISEKMMLTQDINSDYYVQGNESRVLKLIKLKRSGKKENSKIIDGIEVSSPETVRNEFVRINCNGLKYQMCVDRIKNNLNNIIASNDKNSEFQIVKLEDK